MKFGYEYEFLDEGVRVRLPLRSNRGALVFSPRRQIFLRPSRVGEGFADYIFNGDVIIIEIRRRKGIFTVHVFSVGFCFEPYIYKSFSFKGERHLLPEPFHWLGVDFSNLSRYFGRSLSSFPWYMRWAEFFELYKVNFVPAVDLER